MKMVSFFILHDARSGSTFLANQLIKKYNVFIPPENNIVSLLINNFGIENKNEAKLLIDKVYQDDKFYDWKIEKVAAEKLFDGKKKYTVLEFLTILFHKYLKETKKNNHIFGIKKGSYIDNWQKLSVLFPESKYICLIRDGRAVFNSKKKSLYSKTGRPFEEDPVKAANIWIKRVQRIRSLEHHKPSQTLVVKYEDLVCNNEKVLSQVARFIDKNIKISVNEKSSFAIDRYKQFNLHQNIDKPPLLENTSKWKKELTKEDLLQYEVVAMNTLLSEGYQLESNRLNRFKAIFANHLKKTKIYRAFR